MRTGPHVLVVDDQTDFRESIVSLLTTEGFRVSNASSGDEALTMLESASLRDKIDILLLDYRMPGRNGGQTLKEMRARGVRARAILVSATPGIEVLRLMFGFDEALPKPCNFTDLIAAIHRCIGNDTATAAAVPIHATAS
jgi:DNA-binding response OmpR family regulator